MQPVMTAWYAWQDPVVIDAAYAHYMAYANGHTATEPAPEPQAPTTPSSFRTQPPSYGSDYGSPRHTDNFAVPALHSRQPTWQQDEMLQQLPSGMPSGVQRANSDVEDKLLSFIQGVPPAFQSLSGEQMAADTRCGGGNDLLKALAAMSGMK
jgi:hypothetical protein